MRLFKEETQNTEPILFILSPGADPSQELEDLAKGTVGLDKYHQVFTMSTDGHCFNLSFQILWKFCCLL